MLPPGTDENDNAAMCRVYNTIDAYAEKLGAAFILVHHTSKGNQSGKGVTDVGSGAGSISRATDSHLILRPHEEPNCAVLEAAVRSWPPVEPRALRWTFPVWTPDDTLDPQQLRNFQTGTRAKKCSETNGEPDIHWTPEQFVKTFLTATRQATEFPPPLENAATWANVGCDREPDQSPCCFDRHSASRATILSCHRISAISSSFAGRIVRISIVSSEPLAEVGIKLIQRRTSRFASLFFIDGLHQDVAGERGNVERGHDASFLFRNRNDT